jgi:hypothetical protein
MLTGSSRLWLLQKSHSWKNFDWATLRQGSFQGSDGQPGTRASLILDEKKWLAGKERLAA